MLLVGTIYDRGDDASTGSNCCSTGSAKICRVTTCLLPFFFGDPGVRWFGSCCCEEGVCMLLSNVSFGCADSSSVPDNSANLSLAVVLSCVNYSASIRHDIG